MVKVREKSDETKAEEANKMADKIIAETTKEVVAAVAKDVYKDGLQPATKEIGTSLQTLTSAVNAALVVARIPIQMVRAFEEVALERINIVKEQAIANLRTRRVPDERIIVPSATVVGPAIQAMMFAADDPELRDMFASLLATAMDSATAHKAHPAFVEVIRQLTPDEARIIRLFLTSRKFPIWHFETITYHKDENGLGSKETLMKMEYMSLIGYDAGCEHLDLVPSYINNLCRLGFAYLTSKQLPHVFRNDAMLKSPNPEYSDPRLGELIEKTPEVTDVLKQIASPDQDNTNLGNHIQFWTRYMNVMPFGEQFCAACVVPSEYTA